MKKNIFILYNKDGKEIVRTIISKRIFEDIKIETIINSKEYQLFKDENPKLENFIISDFYILGNIENCIDDNRDYKKWKNYIKRHYKRLFMRYGFKYEHIL